MGKFEDLTGQKFGLLTVIKRAENSKDNKVQWLCECECGNFTTVRGKCLKSEHTKSCGCLRKETFTTKTHGKSHSRLHNIWLKIKDRCNNKNCKCYKRYGGRGITISNEWSNDFQAFYDWAITNGYADDLTIDRIDNSKGYSPDNCRWATAKEQNNNKRNNHLITYNGKTQTLAQWAEEYHINYGTLKSRINRNRWSIEKALNESTS